MGSILVTGGTGTLGRIVVERLNANCQNVRVLSRRPRPPGTEATAWATGDLRKGSGIDAAVAGVDVIVHCATGRGDVAAARHLIEAARRAGGPHLVCISIVGVDRMPYLYYKSKLAVEGQAENSGLPWTLLRATQFHDLILVFCRALARLPVLPVAARTPFQPIDAREVAARLAELAVGPAAGRIPDMGGPEVRGFAEFARGYLAASGHRRPVLPVRLPGAMAAGFRRGDHLAPDHAVGRTTFAQFLSERLGPGRDR